MIVQLRIDERLIHGQVAAAWARTLDMTHIVCASDIAIKDTLRCKVLMMAAPAGKKVFIKGVDEAIRLIDDPRADSMKIFLITDTPASAVKLCEALPIKEVNVTNYHKAPVTQKVYLHDMCVTDNEEFPVFERLVEVAKEIYTQFLPTVDKIDFKELVKNAKSQQKNK